MPQSVQDARMACSEGHASADTKRSRRRYQTGQSAAATVIKRPRIGGGPNQTDMPAESANRSNSCKFAVTPPRVDMAQWRQRTMLRPVHGAQATSSACGGIAALPNSAGYELAYLAALAANSTGRNTR
jgi:hypothetical protein